MTRPRPTASLEIGHARHPPVCKFPKTNAQDLVTYSQAGAQEQRQGHNRFGRLSALHSQAEAAAEEDIGGTSSSERAAGAATRSVRPTEASCPLCDAKATSVGRSEGWKSPKHRVRQFGCLPARQRIYATCRGALLGTGHSLASFDTRSPSRHQACPALGPAAVSPAAWWFCALLASLGLPPALSG